MNISVLLYFKIMKTTFKILLICLSIFWLNNSCSSDNAEPTFVNDFTITMDENPTKDQLIGIIPFESDKGESITTSILTQTVANAIHVPFPDGLYSNKIFVNNPVLFDFETNPVLKVTLKVTKVRLKLDFVTMVPLDTKTITVTIDLKDLRD
jgi:hypothetical protein